MRGRIGGRIGTAILPYGSSVGYSIGAAKGVWGLGEVFAASRGFLGSNFEFFGASTWPANSVLIAWPYVGWPVYANVDWIDATGTGAGTFSPQVTTDYESVSYSWEKSTNAGSTWSAVSGQTAASLELTGLTLADDGTLYRLVADAGLKVVRSSAGTVRYDTVTLSVQQHPSSQVTTSTAWFSCSITATGTTYGATYQPAFQWQRSTNGGTTWADISGQTDYYLSISATASDDGHKFRCVGSFAGQTITTNAATLVYG